MQRADEAAFFQLLQHPVAVETRRIGYGDLGSCLIFDLFFRAYPIGARKERKKPY
jgi:hypothetical protein